MVGMVTLLFLLVIVPTVIAYIGASIYQLAVWSSVLVGLASSMVIFLSLVFLLGAAVRFPDHLPWPENDSEM